MKLKTFFEKFDQFADAPDAVVKMRELVLQLAVQGGLVPHSAAEPAVPYDSAKDAKPINVSEVPGNWRVVLLADAIKNRSGNSKLIKGKLHDTPTPNLFQGFSASGPDVWCEDYEHEGDAIIISAVGARCGKAFKASGKWSAVANTNIARPEPTLFDFDFAYLVLNDERFWIRGGSAQPFVKFPPSLDRHFALPPLAEQKRIVAKVDELMALCDRLEAQQQERETRHAALVRASLARFADAPSPTNLNFLFQPSYTISPADLRKSILTLAVQGKLVPQDPDDEPAAGLLERIEMEKSRRLLDGTIRNLKPTAPITDADKEFELPLNWEWARMGQIVKLWNGFAFKSCDFQNAGIPVIRIGDLQNGLVDATTVVCVSEEVARTVGQEFWIPQNALLIAMSGATTGKVAINKTGRRLLLNQRVGRLEPILVSTDYVRFFFETIVSRNLSISFGSAIPNLSAEQINGTVLPLPPLAEQRRIVAKVDQMMALVDALEIQLAASRRIAINLVEAVVSELSNAA